MMWWQQNHIAPAVVVGINWWTTCGHTDHKKRGFGVRRGQRFCHFGPRIRGTGDGWPRTRHGRLKHFYIVIGRWRRATMPLRGPWYFCTRCQEFGVKLSWVVKDQGPHFPVAGLHETRVNWFVPCAWFFFLQVEHDFDLFLLICDRDTLLWQFTQLQALGIDFVRWQVFQMVEIPKLI